MKDKKLYTNPIITLTELPRIDCLQASYQDEGIGNEFDFDSWND